MFELELGKDNKDIERLKTALERTKRVHITQKDEDYYMMSEFAKVIKTHMAGVTDRFLISEYLAFLCEGVYGEDDGKYFKLHDCRKMPMRLIRHDYYWTFHRSSDLFVLYDNGKPIWKWRKPFTMSAFDMPINSRNWLKKNGVKDGIIEYGYEWDIERKGI